MQAAGGHVILDTLKKRSTREQVDLLHDMSKTALASGTVDEAFVRDVVNIARDSVSGKGGRGLPRLVRMEALRIFTNVAEVRPDLITSDHVNGMKAIVRNPLDEDTCIAAYQCLEVVSRKCPQTLSPSNGYAAEDLAVDGTNQQKNMHIRQASLQVLENLSGLGPDDGRLHYPVSRYIAAPLIGAAVGDADKSIRSSALRILGAIGNNASPREAAMLVDVVMDHPCKQPELFMQALAVTLANAPQAATESMVRVFARRAIKEEDRHVRAAARQVLGAALERRPDHAQIVFDIVESAAISRDADIRLDAQRVLAVMAEKCPSFGTQISSLLYKTMEDKDWEVRAATQETGAVLAKNRKAAVNATLIRVVAKTALHDIDADVRQAALKHLTVIAKDRPEQANEVRKYARAAQSSVRGLYVDAARESVDEILNYMDTVHEAADAILRGVPEYYSSPSAGANAATVMPVSPADEMPDFALRGSFVAMAAAQQKAEPASVPAAQPFWESPQQIQEIADKAPRIVSLPVPAAGSETQRNDKESGASQHTTPALLKARNITETGTLPEVPFVLRSSLVSLLAASELLVVPREDAVSVTSDTGKARPHKPVQHDKNRLHAPSRPAGRVKHNQILQAG
ncbi:MAG: hypothetical protein WDO70_10535 [Alphaproteobacteria bacterium]